MPSTIPSRIRPTPIAPPPTVFASHRENSSDDSQSSTPATSIADDWRPDSAIAIAQDKPAFPFPSLKDKQQITNRDLEQIWSWNANLPTTDHRLVQQLIAQHVQDSPDSQALQSWDGSLTYRELDTFSTSLAGALQERGIGPGACVPLLFPKSMWTTVAFLGVIKAGGAAVLLGTNQPADRMRQICHQVEAKLVLSAPETAALANDIAEDVLVVDSDLVEETRYRTRFEHPTTLKPDDAVVVTFTSGSTGVPKGAILTHANICSQFKHHRSILDYTPRMRMYDFAAHAFDIANINILDTLCAGGCICVPAEQDKKNEVEGSFERLKATHFLLTPTILRTLDPLRMPGAKTLIVGGEILTSSDLQSWTPHVDTFVNAYGPAECSCIATVGRFSDDKHTPNIGRGVGQCTWVVDPDSDVLVPIGAEGELVLEGPLVGAGYVGGVAANAAFIRDPSWLTTGSENVVGRQGRLYRTGDMVRYDSTGTLWYLGRKDAQAKLRGQRIELEEVQVHVSSSLGNQYPLVAEVILPQDSDRAVLVVFMQRAEPFSPIESTRLKLDIAEHLPSYMIPTFFIPISAIPLTLTGKTDRKKLREIGGAMSVEALTSAARLAQHDDKDEPLVTQPEQQLGRLWASALNVTSNLIHADSDFIELGGDSLAAIRLSQVAREQGLRLAVTAILASPVLREMSLKMTPITELQPMMKKDIVANQFSERLTDIMATSNISMDNVDAVLPPLTHNQKHFVPLLKEVPQGWLLWMWFDFTKPLDFSRLESACRTLVASHDILRTVLVEEEQEWLHVVLKQVEVNVCSVLALDSISDCGQRLMDEDAEPGFVLGDLCFRFWHIKGPSGASRLMFRLPHTHYDYIGAMVMLDNIARAYDGLPLPEAGRFADVIRNKCDNHTPATINYWLDLFRGCSMTEIGRPFKYTDPQVGADIKPIGLYTMPMLTLPPGVTLGTLVNACWATTLASVLGLDDVIFTNVNNGRLADVRNVLNVAGPCTNFITYRVRFEGLPKVSDVLDSLSAQYLSGLANDDVWPFELSPEITQWPVGTYPTSLLLIQMQNPNPAFEMAGEKVELSWVARDWTPLPFSAFVYPVGDTLMVACQRNQAYVDLVLGEKLALDWVARLREFSA